MGSGGYGQSDSSLWLLQKCTSQREVQEAFFVTFNFKISHTFPENFIEIPQVVQVVWRFSSSIVTVFINFTDFLTFPC